MAKFTLFILTHFLKGMTPSEFLTRYSLAGSNLLVLPPPTVASAPQDKSARISGKLSRRNQGVKAWMSEKCSERGSVFYHRHSLRPTFISSFGNIFLSLLIFLFFLLAGGFRKSLCRMTWTVISESCPSASVYITSLWAQKHRTWNDLLSHLLLALHHRTISRHLAGFTLTAVRVFSPSLLWN